MSSSANNSASGDLGRNGFNTPHSIFISNEDLLKACTTIIAFTFASLGFLLNARNSEAITKGEFNAIVRSLLLILLMFSIPILVYLLLDLLQVFIPEYIREERLGLLTRLTKVYFLLSFLTIPFAFLVISDALDVDLLEGTNALWFLIALIFVVIFLTIIIYFIFQEIAERLVDELSDTTKNIRFRYALQRLAPFLSVLSVGITILGFSISTFETGSTTEFLMGITGWIIVVTVIMVFLVQVIQEKRFRQRHQDIFTLFEKENLLPGEIAMKTGKTEQEIVQVLKKGRRADSL